MDRKLMRMVSLGTLVIVLLVSGLAHSYPVLASTVSTTHHVAPSGQNTAGCGSQTEPCRTIQYAVNQAVSGDTIRVAAGTYTFESDTDVCTGRIGGTSAVVCYFDKELTILGGFAPSSWTRQNVVANPTIIDGQGVWRAVRLQKSYPTAPTASLNMAGFTIRNGYAVGRSSGSADATNSFGGGLLSEHASVTLADMVFVDNRSQGGSTTGVGGAGAGGAVAVNTTWGGVSAVLHSISFENNQAIGGSGGIRGGHGIGGALFTYGITFRGEGITFKDNRAAAGNSTAGSGVGDGERADGQGAAAAFHGASVAALYDVTATNNTTQGGSAPAGEAGGAFGGAFFVEDSSLAIYDSQVRNNTALGGNGRNPTNVAGQAWGGGICSMNANLTVSRVEVVSNRAQGGDGVVYGGAVSGGGIAVVSVTTARRSVVVNNTIVAANYAGVGQGRLVGGGGGGVWILGVDADLLHTTISGNLVQQDLLGQGVILVTGAMPTRAVVRNSIISDHAGLVHTAALHAQVNTSVTLDKVMYAANAVDDNHDRNYAGPPGTFQGLTSVIHETSTVNYVSPSAPNHDYRLRRDSPARDRVSPVILDVDIDQQPRTGSADLGADEYVIPIDLSARALDAETLHVVWRTDALHLLSPAARYRLQLACEPGASSPLQVKCGSSVDVGVELSAIKLTNLTEHAKYTVSIAIVDSSGQVVETSEPIVAFPTSIFAFVPMVSK